MTLAEHLPESAPTKDNPRLNIDAGPDGGEFTGFVVNNPLAPDEYETAFQKVYKLAGLDPADYRIVDDTVRFSVWQTSARDKNTGHRDLITLYSYRARFQRISAMDVRTEQVVHELAESFRKRKGSAARRTPGTGLGPECSYVVGFSDWQIGKPATREGDPGETGVEQTVNRVDRAIEQSKARIKNLRRTGRNITGISLLHMGDPTENVADSYCVGADEPVLTRDLRWVRAGDLVVGQELYALEEEPADSTKGRAFLPSRVTSHEVRNLPARLVTFSDGRTLICTPEHPLLARRVLKHGVGKWAWVPVEDMAGEITGTPRRPGPRRSSSFEVMSIGTPWTRENSWESGWMAGFLDGEGCLTQGSDRVSGNLTFAQKPGGVLDRAVQILSDRGFRTRITMKAESGVATGVFLGGHYERLRALGTFAPGRLLPKVQFPYAYSSTGGHANPQVVAVEDLGTREIAMMSTSTKTYFANGFASHNSSQTFDVELNLQQQIELALRLMVAGAEELLPLAEHRDMLFVLCNHGQMARRGTKTNITNDADNVQNHLAHLLRDWIVGPKMPDVRWHIPGEQMITTATIADVPIAAAHGHKITGREDQWLLRQTANLTASRGHTPRVWVTAHRHSQDFLDLGSVVRIQCATADGGSKHFTDNSGIYSTPGTTTFLLGNHAEWGISDLELL